MKKLLQRFAAVVAAFASAVGNDSNAAEIDFERDVQPILNTHCASCHGAKKQQGSLRFDSREGAIRAGDSGELAIVPGHADKSELLRRVSSPDKTDRMPPEGAALTPPQIDVLRRWIAEGAKWPAEASAALAGRQELQVTDADRKHWAFLPLRAVEPPAVKHSDWPRTPIDRFILAGLEAKQLSPAPPADRQKLIRRIFFDLTGLPPTPEDMEKWNSRSVADLADQLLASQHYGERWGRHWLDVARYADSHGQEGDGDRPNAYHYRDFVIRALNDDLPFNTFVRWQLAGEEIEPDNPLAVSAMGFLAAGPHTVLMVPMEDEHLRNRYNELDDMLSTIGTGLLGLTLGCARCHDHKYDAIPTRDYYRMLAAVHSGQREDALLGSRAEIAKYKQQHAEWEPKFKAAESRLNDWLGKQKRPFEARLRSAKIDALPISAEEKSLLRDKPKDVDAKKLAKKHELALRIGDDEFRREMTTEQRQHWDELAAALKEVRDREPKSPPAAYVYRDPAPDPKPTWLFGRGDYYDRDEPVQLGFLTALTTGKTAEEYFQAARADRQIDSTYQRRALADWITDTEHGAGNLLARVIVNRVWQHHFGEGLVRTVSDFGVQGERPTHPELLEWLASDFVANGWKLKRLHRMIVTSAVYQQGSAFDLNKARIDPENRLLGRMRPQRLEAEILRDSILSVSGALNPEAYGPGFKPPIAIEAIVARNLKSPYPKDAQDSPDTHRRTVYMFHKRVVPYPLMRAFDAPDAQQSCGRRNQTTVSPQALALLNDPFVRNRALQFADRLENECGSELHTCVERAYRLAFSREPQASERDAAMQFLQAQIESRQARIEQMSDDDARRLAIADFCQALFSLNEFIYVD